MAQEEFMTDGKISGVIDHIYDPQKITFADGKEKHKISVSIKIEGKFPKNVIVDFWGHDEMRQVVGQKVDVYFNVKSRVNKSGYTNHSVSGYAIRPSGDDDTTMGSQDDAQSDQGSNQEEGAQNSLPF